MNPTQFRQYLLAGTVSFPGVFPQVAEISLKSFDEVEAIPKQRTPWLVATQYPAPRVCLTRTVSLQDVRAVFLPDQVDQVSYDRGTWLLDDEVLSGLLARLQQSQRVFGIVYVPETAPSLLEMSAGMTAGESIQYYPPLPRDPANNHYNPLPKTSPIGTGPIMVACEQPTDCENVSPWPPEHWDDFLGQTPFMIACE